MNKTEMPVGAPVTPEDEVCETTEIGSDADFAARALERETWKSLEIRERQENTSIKRSSLMREGFHAGFEAAASDFSNKTATIEHFEGLREQRDSTDFYAIGFELGYYRKLAELLVA